MHPETKTALLVVLFQQDSSSLVPFHEEVERLRQKYQGADLNIITVKGDFSRGVALNEATHSDHIQTNDIIFFIDVDITFKRISIDRIRLNTKKRKQVYMPIVFSQYNPNVWSSQSPAGGENDFSRYDDNGEVSLSNESGYFRQFGYGICAIYKMDILHPKINGFDSDITGWGLEDVKFLEKIVKLHQTPTTPIVKNIPEATPMINNSTVVPLTLKIFRAPDPTLVHIYHDIHCDKSLSEAQYNMCLGTMASTLGSYKYIESIFMNNQTIIDFIRQANSIS